MDNPQEVPISRGGGGEEGKIMFGSHLQRLREGSGS